MNDNLKMSATAAENSDSSQNPASVAGGPTQPIINYFATPAVAERYARSRPGGHARVLEVLQQALRGHLPVERALDVGCGAGHSTQALLPYARAIVGVDSSSEMLRQAARDPRIAYRKGYAEALPCRSSEYDLVSVSSAYHWFDHERFLREAARTLRPGGWLLLYKAGSMGRLPGRPDFEFWRREVLRARYPKVARNDEVLTASRAADFGFAEVLCETATRFETRTLRDYIENLLTHSSVVRVVDAGLEPVESAREWLRRELAPFFPAIQTEFAHEDRIHVLRRSANA